MTRKIVRVDGYYVVGRYTFYGLRGSFLHPGVPGRQALQFAKYLLLCCTAPVQLALRLITCEVYSPTRARVQEAEKPLLQISQQNVN